MKIQCPNCRVSYRLDSSKVSDKGISSQCAKCQTRFILLKFLGDEKGKATVTALALITPDISGTPCRIYARDPKEMIVYLKNLVEEREGLLKYKNSLVDTKLALEESVSDLMKTKAKVRMLEEELRRIRTMSWWRRLLWR